MAYGWGRQINIVSRGLCGLRRGRWDVERLKDQCICITIRSRGWISSVTCWKAIDAPDDEADNGHCDC